jgi:hypothetical protein
MGFEIRYDNPYSAGVGDGLMEGAREEVDFARTQANQRLVIADRNLQLERAKLNFSKKQTELDSKLRDRALKLQERQQGFAEDKQFPAERDWRDKQVERWDRTDTLSEKQEGRLTKEQELNQKRMDKSEADRLRNELNTYRAAGARMAKKGETPGKGEVEQTLSNGMRMILPDPVARQLEAQNQEREAKRQWYLENGYPDPYAEQEKVAKPTVLEVPPEWAPTIYSDPSMEGLPEAEKKRRAVMLFEGRLDDDPVMHKQLEAFGLTAKDAPDMIAAVRDVVLPKLKPQAEKDAATVGTATEAYRELFKLLKDGVEMPLAVEFWDQAVEKEKLDPKRFPFPWEKLAETIRQRKESNQARARDHEVMVKYARSLGLKVDDDTPMDRLVELTLWKKKELDEYPIKAAERVSRAQANRIQGQTQKSGYEEIGRAGKR